MRLAFVSIVLLPIIVSANALAATTNVVIQITSPPSTAVNCVVDYPSGQTSFVEPVASGTLVATCTVVPSTWSGAFTLSGADASFFTLSGTNVAVGSSALTAPRIYNINLTATP